MRKILASLVLITHTDKYLEECMESLSRQTIRDNIKLIMIDNGSPRSAGGMFERYGLEGDYFERFEDNELKGKFNYALNMFGEGCAYTLLMDDDILPEDGLEKRLMPILDGRAEAVYTEVEHFGDGEIEKRKAM